MFLAVAMLCHGKRQNTTSRSLKAKPRVEAKIAVDADTLTGDALAAIVIAGYDKPLRSSRETFFVSNNTGCSLRSLKFRIDYTDTAGRSLHSRTDSISCDIAPGETRNHSIKSWDLQQSFYYRLSRRPKHATATAFDVRFTLLEATVTCPANR